jgi:hypothetical protein
MALTEISLKLPNRAGTLVGVARILATHRINLAAISVDSTDRVGNVRLVVNDTDRAIRLLRKGGYNADVHELLAIHLEDKAGTFLQVLEVLAKAKINVRGVVILVTREGSKTLVGLQTNQSAKARDLLKKSGFISERAERLVSNEDLLAAAQAIPAESVGMLL